MLLYQALPLKLDSGRPVGCSRELVKKVAAVGTTSSESEQTVPVPSWVTHKDMQAAFRKLPADERARLEPVPYHREMAPALRPSPPAS